MTRFDYSKIPERTLESLDAWIKSGRPLGQFSAAVVRNDLFEAVARADEENLRALPEIVAYLINKAPALAIGPKALERWPLVLKERASV